MYDLEVDSGRDSAEECAGQSARRIAQPIPPDAFQRLNERYQAELP